MGGRKGGRNGFTCKYTGMHCPGGQTDRGPLLGSIDRASGGRVIE